MGEQEWLRCPQGGEPEGEAGGGEGSLLQTSRLLSKSQQTRQASEDVARMNAELMQMWGHP